MGLRALFVPFKIAASVFIRLDALRLKHSARDQVSGLLTMVDTRYSDFLDFRLLFAICENETDVLEGSGFRDLARLPFQEDEARIDEGVGSETIHVYAIDPGNELSNLFLI
jgi:hypothetical protein